MAARIRLRRTGAKKKPHYRVVVADSRAQRDGRFIEILGHYDPLPDPPVISLKHDRVQDWLGKGAQPTETVIRLLKSSGIAVPGDRAAVDREGPAVGGRRQRAAGGRGFGLSNRRRLRAGLSKRRFIA